MAGQAKNPRGFGPGVDNSGAGLTNPYAAQGLNAAGLAAFAMPSAQADQAQQTQAGYSATIERLSTPPAEAATQSSNVWVTVPVDKVTVAGGAGTLTQPQEPRQGPTYQTMDGYAPAQQPTYPPMQGNTIPPTPAAGKVSRT